MEVGGSGVRARCLPLVKLNFIIIISASHPASKGTAPAKGAAPSTAILLSPWHLGTTRRGGTTHSPGTRSSLLRVEDTKCCRERDGCLAGSQEGARRRIKKRQDCRQG